MDSTAYETSDSRTATSLVLRVVEQFLEFGLWDTEGVVVHADEQPPEFPSGDRPPVLVASKVCDEGLRDLE